MSQTILKALAVMAELTSTDWSREAVEMIELELKAYPEQAVLAAIRECQKTSKGRVRLADILACIPGRHLGAEQAWALVAPKVKSDAPTVFMTDEMRTAYGTALALEDDMIAARMAFKETYEALVRQSEQADKLPTWSIVPGTDPNSKSLAIHEAVKKGIAQLDWAMRQLPVEAHDSLLAIDGQTDVKRLRIA